MPRLFPLAIIGLFLGATIEAAWSLNWRMAVFYLCSAILNVVVAF